ncbi:hypothetical protein [Thauera aromatica]|nr:hypothetical protein [Thauera aromatica]
MDEVLRWIGLLAALLVALGWVGWAAGCVRIQVQISRGDESQDS